MDILQTVILGLVQGFTEWLPISSSGHLVIAQKLMNVTLPVAFDVMLHMGTLLAVIIFFWKDIMKILKSLLNLNLKDENFKLFIYVLIGTIPTAIIGLLFLKFFESLFSSVKYVGIGFLITAALLLFSKFRNGDKKLNWLKSLIIGLAQGIAIAPGISRSGSTMSVGLLSGVNKKDVFKYSFLLCIPAVIGASIIEYKSLAISDFGVHSVIGLIVAAVSGYFAIKIVHKVLLSEKFYIFAVYCFLAGLISLAVIA